MPPARHSGPLRRRHGARRARRAPGPAVRRQDRAPVRPGRWHGAAPPAFPRLRCATRAAAALLPRVAPARRQTPRRCQPRRPQPRLRAGALSPSRRPARNPRPNVPMRITPPRPRRGAAQAAQDAAAVGQWLGTNRSCSYYVLLMDKDQPGGRVKSVRVHDRVKTTAAAFALRNLGANRRRKRSSHGRRVRTDSRRP